MVHQQSMESGLAAIVPILKKGKTPGSPEPVSLTSNFGILVERMAVTDL